MAGDQVSALVQYYHQSTATSTKNNLLPDILTNLVMSLGANPNAAAMFKSNLSAVQGQLSNTPGFITQTQPQTINLNAPLAYLTVLFFDERFNFIAAADGGAARQQVLQSVDQNGAQLVIAGMKAPKNGYAYVYISNQSVQDVFFDSLRVGINAGNIVEENHYYAFGLKIAGISSRKLSDRYEGLVKNNNLYNDKELFDDGDLDWYDYGFRNYDPQIGRFVQIDPLTDEYAPLSGYHYAANDPIGNGDADGLSVISSLGQAACWSGQSMAMVNMLNTLGVVANVIGITSDVLNVAGKTGQVVNDATVKSQINGQLKTQGVGQKSLDGQKNPSSSASQKMKMDEMESQRVPFYSEPISYFRNADNPFKNNEALQLDRHNDRVRELRLRAQIKQDEKDKAAVILNMLLFAAPEATAFINEAEKAIVIGEGMGRVKQAAQSMGAKWYQAWSKNFVEGRLMTDAELTAAKARNGRWIQSKIKAGYKIYDIGIDPTRAIRSPFYELEKFILQQNNYPVYKLPRL